MVKGYRRRDGSGRFTRGVAAAERDAEACWMKERGATYEEISDALGYGGKQNAHRAIKLALAALPSPAADELRTMQLRQLDYMKRKVLEVLETEHLTISQGGKIVYDGKQKVIDQGPILQALDRFLRIQERESKLMGLDAPSRREVLTLDAIDAELARLLAENDDESASDQDSEAEAAP